MRLVLAIMGMLLISAVNLSAADKVEAVGIFSDNMVLQAGMDVPVWGSAPKGSEVTVEFAGQKKTAKVDDKGYWMVKLSALKASKSGAVMTISCGADKTEIKNVIVGEVWVCSGQSNMAYAMSGLKVQYDKPVKPLVEAIEKANLPLLRQYTFKFKTSSKGPVRIMGGVWEICTPKSVDHFTATGFFFGRELLEQLNTPIGLIKVAVGGTPVEAWTPRDVLEKTASGKEYIPLWEKQAAEYNEKEAMAKFESDLKEWEEGNKAAKAAGKKFNKRKPAKWRYAHPNFSSHYPSTLFNGMINPIIPYAIAGAIWYQGENNANNNAKYYEESFKSMITAWRKLWNQGDFPFYTVQLANFSKESVSENISNWAVVREAQRKSLELPNTGMAVIIDVGEAGDIHPRNKIAVGKRLAYWALNKNYGKKDLVYSGPLFKSAKAEGGKIVVTFDEVGGGLMVGKKADVWAPAEASDAEITQFFVAGKDGKFKPAKVKITGKDTLEVWSESVKEPADVRFAPENNPQGFNLYNKEGLPASPFYTR